MKEPVNITDGNCFMGREADDSCAIEGYGVPELLQKQRREKEMINSAKAKDCNICAGFMECKSPKLHEGKTCNHFRRTQGGIL